MNIRSRVLVTGSDGFVGRHLVPYLAALDYEVIAASRAPAGFQVPNVKTVQIPDLSVPVNWHSMLLQCDIVVHLAGIAHETAVDDLYDRVNHQATAALAYAAQRCGVKHLIFISSIAAQCGSFSDHELTEDDPPRPNSAYGRSKLAAENAIRMSGVSFTILRPVLIYGGDNKGRGAILQMISRLPIPLPFGALKAKRSLLSIENFNSAVAKLLSDPRARGETFIVSDPTPVSVADLITRHRIRLGRSSWLLPVPERWLELFLRAVGQGAVWERIGRPLIAKPTKLLAVWNPAEPSSAQSKPNKA